MCKIMFVICLWSFEVVYLSPSCLDAFPTAPIGSPQAKANSPFREWAWRTRDIKLHRAAR